LRNPFTHIRLEKNNLKGSASLAPLRRPGKLQSASAAEVKTSKRLGLTPTMAARHWQSLSGHVTRLQPERHIRDRNITIVTFTFTAQAWLSGYETKD
jgi:hypothetical protein